MTFEERIRLINRLDTLIKMKLKGDAITYSETLGISRATFFRLLNVLKNEYDAGVSYNKIDGCYEYSSGVSLSQSEDARARVLQMHKKFSILNK
jgi:hypothetical protein